MTKASKRKASPLAGDDAARDHVVKKSATCTNCSDKSKENIGQAFHRLFGFHADDLTSWPSLVRLLCRPSDPAALGVLRFLFGFLMILDTFQERGLGMADMKWGNPQQCHFPLFNFLRPLPLQWIYIVYFLMLLGAVGIMLGFKFHSSCLLYLGPYWYFFFLEKTTWNNHSYLFGVLAFLFFMSDANRYWSLDGLLDPKIQNSHIPLWNYTLFRIQIFLVYFIAGLKKLDRDWVSGYSMQTLSQHWMFDPFKLVMTESEIDLYVVHLGGLTIDMFVGFLLFFDKTRLLGLLISSSFNLMNSQIFTIGMFPYAMLSVQTIFCHMSWPRHVFCLIPSSFQLFTPEEGEIKPSGNCIYPKKYIKAEEMGSSSYTPPANVILRSSPSTKHKAAALFTTLFVAWQCFLPYSHGVTKGYNNWTSGLYGYSWDMMIHSWTVQHIRVTYKDKDTGQSGFLDPTIWTGKNLRWSSHSDMLKQYAHCIAHNLKAYDIHNVEIYMDVWKSLNHRFQQRTVDPHVDILTADWNPFKDSPWMFPLMTELSDWRSKLQELELSLNNSSKTQIEVVFVADFPGLYLENYVQDDFGNTSLSVLKGQVIVELLETKKNRTLSPGESMQIPSGMFHNVHTVSEEPSCYMYVFVNTTEAKFLEKYSQFEEDFNSKSANETFRKYYKDPDLQQYQELMAAKKVQDDKKALSVWQQFKKFLQHKYNLFVRSIRLTYGALSCLITNDSFEKYLNASYEAEIANTKS